MILCGLVILKQDCGYQNLAVDRYRARKLT
jgi:hypothetical protein